MSSGAPVLARIELQRLSVLDEQTRRLVEVAFYDVDAVARQNGIADSTTADTVCIAVGQGHETKDRGEAGDEADKEALEGLDVAGGGVAGDKISPDCRGFFRFLSEDSGDALRPLTDATHLIELGAGHGCLGATAGACSAHPETTVLLTDVEGFLKLARTTAKLNKFPEPKPLHFGDREMLERCIRSVIFGHGAADEGSRSPDRLVLPGFFTGVIEQVASTVVKQASEEVESRQLQDRDQDPTWRVEWRHTGKDRVQINKLEILPRVALVGAGVTYWECVFGPLADTVRQFLGGSEAQAPASPLFIGALSEKLCECFAAKGVEVEIGGPDVDAEDAIRVRLLEGSSSASARNVFLGYFKRHWSLEKRFWTKMLPKGECSLSVQVAFETCLNASQQQGDRHVFAPLCTRDSEAANSKSVPAAADASAGHSEPWDARVYRICAASQQQQSAASATENPAADDAPVDWAARKEQQRIAAKRAREERAAAAAASKNKSKSEGASGKKSSAAQEHEEAERDQLRRKEQTSSVSKKKNTKGSRKSKRGLGGDTSEEDFVIETTAASNGKKKSGGRRGGARGGG